MNKETREKFNGLRKAMGESYGAHDVTEQFTATVPMSQTLNNAIQDSDGFLQRISIVPRTDLKGEVLNMSILSTIAGRTDTSGSGERTPQQAGGPSGRQYDMQQTDYDVAIPYSLLDTWARFKDFRQRYSLAVNRRIGLDRLLIGWYGTSAAATTNRGTNALLQDVNKGWLHDLKTNKASHYITEGGTAGQIKVGASGDYKNLDHLVFSLHSILPKAHLTGNEVAIIGQGLVANEMGKVLSNHASTPTEKNAIKTLGKNYGGLESVIVPNFPDNGLLVTDPANLHLYYQDSSVRRQSVDEPKKNQVADYMSMQEAFMIGDLDAAAALEAANVQFVS